VILGCEGREECLGAVDVGVTCLTTFDEGEECWMACHGVRGDDL